MVIFDDDVNDVDDNGDNDDNGGNDDNGENDDNDEDDDNGDNNDTKFKDPNVYIVERAVDKKTKVIITYDNINHTAGYTYIHRGASQSIYCYGKAIPKKMLLGYSLHM